MADKATYTSSGVGFSGLLTILFIGLKLTNHINWSWWWVLSPIWISFGLLVVAVLIVAIIAGITTFMKS